MAKAFFLKDDIYVYSLMRLVCLWLFCCCSLAQVYGQSHLSGLLDHGKKLLKNTAFDSAGVLYAEALTRYEAQPTDSLELAEIYYGLGEVGFRTNHYDIGLTYAREALGIREYCYSKEPTYEVVDSYTQVGRLYRRKGNYEKTLEYFELALEVEKTRPNPDLDRISLAYSDLGTLYQNLGEYEKALTYLQLSLEMDLQIHGEDDPEVAILLHNIGIVNSRLGEYDEAIRNTLHALTIRIPVYGEIHREVAKSYYMLGDYYRIKGDYDQALRYNEKAINIWLEIEGPDHASIAAPYILAGIICAEKGDYECALSYNRRALGIQQKQLGKNHPRTAGTLGNIGHIYQLMGDYVSALDYNEQALAMKKERLGPTHPWVSETYRSLGHVHHELVNYPLAIQMYESALAIDRQRLNPDHAVIAENIRYLADVYRSMGKGRQAMAAYQEALVIYRETFGDQHPFLGDLFWGLGAIQREERDWNQAIDYVELGFEALNVEPASHSPDQLPVLDQIAGKLSFLNLLELGGRSYLGRFSETQVDEDLTSALGMYLQAADLIDSIRLGFQYDASKRLLSAQRISIYEGAIQAAYLLNGLQPHPQWIDLAFRLSERSKATLLYESMQKSHALQVGGLPDDLLKQERSLRLDLAFYEKAIYDEKILGKNADEARIQKWETRQFATKSAYDALLTRLETEYPTYHELKYSLEIPNISEVQAALPDSAVGFLEYFVGDRSLYAFLIRRESAQMIQLPGDVSIDSLTTRMRAGLEQGWAPSGQAGMPRTYETAAQKSYSQLIAPLTRLPGGLPTRLIVIPDGVLGYIPFDALLTEPPSDLGKYKFYPYLIRDHQISYAYAARLWLNQHTRSTQADKNWIAFSPAFERSPATRDSVMLRNDFGFLAHSKPEVLGIQDMIGGDVWVDEQASEANFKIQAPDYRIIHISSHAKVNDDNPLYSRIAFTALADTTEDHFLEVAELFNMRLNAEMVVLSACETARGKLYRGEGIVSLARGFTYAGAKSILTTLWSVNDAATAEIMQDFYAQLTVGDAKDQALRQAKLNYLNSQDNLGAHPFYWSGYVMTGEVEPLDLGRDRIQWKWAGLLLLIGFLAIGVRRIKRR